MYGGFDVSRKSIEFLSKMDAYLSVYFDDLVEKFVDCFAEYAEKVEQMQQAGRKEAIAFIHFSVLRTNILAKKHRLRIDAYSQSWYEDRVECSGEYDASEIYKWLEKYEQSLEIVRKQTGGRLTLSELQELVFEEYEKYLPFVAGVLRAGMKKVAETENYNKICKHEVFVVCVGEYQDRMQVVYKADTRVKDACAVKRHLQAGRQEAYAYETCNNLDLTQGNYENIRLMFSSFKGSDLSNSSFRKSIMLGNDFQEAILKDVDLEAVQATDVDFSGAIMENVSFKGARLNQVSFEGATLSRVSFEGAVLLKGLSFENAELIDTSIPIETTGR